MAATKRQGPIDEASPADSRRFSRLSVSDESDCEELQCILSDVDSDETSRIPPLAPGDAGRKPEWLLAWLFESRFGIPCDVQTRMLTKMTKGDLDKVTMFDVAGPAMKPLWRATYVLWSYALVLPWAAESLAVHCTGLGRSAYSIWVWFTFLPVVLMLLVVEWRCLMYTIVPRAQWAPPSWSFRAWLAWTSTLSLIGHADVVTQGLFLASTLRLATCAGWNRISAAWTATWEGSLLHWITFGKDLRLLMMLSWSTLIIQLVFFVSAACPLRRLDYKMGLERTDDGSEQGEPYGYIAVSGAQVWHIDALKSLAALNRMVMLSDGQFEYSMNRADYKLRHDKDGVRCLQVLRMETRQMIQRAVLINFFQNCSKLELQTPVFALGRLTEPGSFDYEAMVAIGLAHLTSLHAWIRLARLVCQVRKQKHKAGNHVKECAAKDIKDSGRVLDEYTLITFNERLAAIIIVACVLTQCHCLVKFIMAFKCDDALWNLPNTCVRPP